nr:MAG TPA: hypothetical protein [Caudoviricetes sp.]
MSKRFPSIFSYLKFANHAPFLYLWTLLINLTRCKDSDNFQPSKLFG